MKKHWNDPIILKGIQIVDDAQKSVELGVSVKANEKMHRKLTAVPQIQGIVVSNHGGRQVDGGVSSLGVLPGIVDAVGDKIDILFDSGIRAGADIAFGWYGICESEASEPEGAGQGGFPVDGFC